MATLTDVQNFIDNNSEICDVGPAASDERIDNAERFLGVRFPEEYREFLQRWGTLSVGPFEFYGVCGDQFESSSIPDGIWFTHVKRRDSNLPNHLIVVGDNEGDAYYCLDTRDSHSPIVVWDVAAREVVEVKADSLSSFILACGEEFLEW